MYFISHLTVSLTSIKHLSHLTTNPKKFPLPLEGI